MRSANVGTIIFKAKADVNNDGISLPSKSSSSVVYGISSFESVTSAEKFRIDARWLFQGFFLPHGLKLLGCLVIFCNNSLDKKKSREMDSIIKNSLKNSSTQRYFSTGEVILIDSIKNEIAKNFSMIISARYGQMSNYAILYISVIDENVNPPKFTESEYVTKIQDRYYYFYYIKPSTKVCLE